jgi:Uma2 family endonuclease
MNAPARLLQAAPAEPTRHRITRAEYHAMAAAEVFAPDIDLELIDGELIDMPADGHRTIEWNAVFARWLFDSLGADFMIIPDKSLEISAHDEPKPDFWIFDAGLKVSEVTGAQVLLIIEIADTTLRLDLRKAEIYARGGVREYWLVDVERRRVLVHRLDGASYGEPDVVAAEDTIAASLIPALKLRIADFARLME